MRRVRTEAQTSGDARVAAWALHRLADHLTDVDQNEEAEKAYARALEEHLESGDLLRAGRAANDLGLLFDEGTSTPPEKLALAALWYGRAADHYARAESGHGRRRALNNKARMHLRAGEFALAIEAWGAAAGEARRLGALEHERLVLANLTLAWLLRAEGGFGGDKDVVEDAQAERMAHAVFALATAAARAGGKKMESVCEVWGEWKDRCDRVGEEIRFPPIPQVPPDPTLIRGRVTSRAFQEARARVRVYPGANRLSLENLPCAKAARARGVFQIVQACLRGDGRARLIERLRARAAGSSAQDGATVTVDAQGFFEVTGLEAGGRYDLVALARDDDPWIAVARGVVAGDQQVELGRVRRGRDQVRVFGPDRARWSEARVILATDETGAAWGVTTDVRGEVDLPAFTEARIALVVGVDGVMGSVLLAEGQPARGHWSGARALYLLQASR